MRTEKNELDDLSRQVKKLIEENKKFLDRVMDDEFEPEGDDEESAEVVEEL